MPRMLGISAPPGLIDDVIIPPEANGVRLISMGFFAREDQAVIWRGPMLHKALEQFLTDVYWGELDYLVVDMPPGTGDISLSIAQFLPRAEVLVVTTPQAGRAAGGPARGGDGREGRPAGDRRDREHVVVHRRRRQALRALRRRRWRGAGRRARRCRCSAQIPLVPELREGGDVGRPIVAVDPDGEVGQVFRALAERLDTELAPKRIYNPELKIN